MNIKLLPIILLFCVILVSGCTSSKPVYSDETYNSKENAGQQTVLSTPTATVATLGDIFVLTENWDADAADDGIEFNLNPKDSDDRPVEVDGIISATLWKKVQESQYSIEYVKGDVIKEWEGIEVKKSNFGFMGAEIRLEFDEDYVPDQYDTGVLEIRFETQDKEFVAETDVLLGF